MCPVKNSAVCAVLDCGELAELRSLGSSTFLKEGETLLHEGDAARYVYSLTHGSLKLYKLLPDGRRQVTGFLYAGDFLGVSIEPSYSYTVEAMEEAALCCFPRERFDAFATKHPALEHELYRLAAHELAAARQQIVLLRKTAAERCASFFDELAGRSENATSVPARFLDLPMSRSDIADHLGLTKETISRVLALFKSRRLIRLHSQNRVEILDRKWLGLIGSGAVDA